MIRLFRVFFPKSVVALLASEALISFLVFVAALYIVFPEEASVTLWYENGFVPILVIVGSTILALYFQDLYTELHVRSIGILIQQVTLTVGMIFLLQAVFAYAYRPLMMSRWVLMVGCGMLLLLLPLWRILYTRVVYKGLGIDSLLFVGTNPIALEIAERITAREELGFKLLGFMSETPDPPANASGDLNVLGHLSTLSTVAKQLRPSRIVVSLAERRSVLPVYDLLDLRFGGTCIEEVTTTYEAVFGRIPIRTLTPSQLIFSSEMGPRPWGLRTQALFSFFVGLVGLIVLSPVMLIVALLVKLTSAGPALYCQTRTGLHGEPFTVYKFRSMGVNAEAKTGAVWATKNDPRITPFGRFIRKTRLDELPQLFNVVRGDMTVVGPRPERPEFVEVLSEKIPFYPHRHSVKPGLTGWAQINYKYGDTLEDTMMKLEYDLYYIKHLSVTLDMYIMFQTVKTMLLTRGAH